MFRIKSDNYEIYNLKNEKKYIVESPKLTQELNKSGDLSFYLPPTHPNYERITGLTSRIQLYNNNVLEFAGRTIENKDSFYKKRYIKVEGELSYLCDSIQRLAVYRCTPLQFFTQIIQNHNSQVEEAKRFNVGMFTISDANNYIYRYTNYEDTLTVLNEKLIKSLGGFLRVRYANGNRYLDLLEDYGKTNSQVIRFGKNILDLDKYIKFSSIKTAMIPLGTETNETVSTQDETGTIKKRLTITDYPDGEYGDIVKSGDMIYSKSGVQNYGYIFASKEDSTFKDVTLAGNLYSKSVSKLNSLLNSSLTIELNAIDLSLINVDIEKIELGDRIKVLSPPHNLNEYFVVSKIVKDLSNPKNNKITLGNTIKNLTSSINSSNTVINSNINELAGNSTNAVNEAKQSATDLLNSVQGGYVRLLDNELYILDNLNINQAQKIWRWNLNGLGYTNNGINGTFGLAMTMDGQIVADYITTGTLRSIAIQNGNNFSVDASGNVLITSSNSDRYKYTTLDAYMALSHIRGDISLPTTLYNLYNVNGGNLDVTDVVKMLNIRNGTDDPVKTINYSVSINPNDINNTIVLKLDNDLQTNIGAFQIYTYMMKATQLFVGNGNSGDISSASYGIKLDGQNKKITITDTGQQVETTIDAGKVDAYNVYCSSGGAKGYCVHGINTSHSYMMNYGNYNGTVYLAIYVDGTSNEFPIIKSVKVDAQQITQMRHAVSYIEYIVAGYGAFGINGIFQSDTKLKENVEDSEINALNVINSFRHIQFDWKKVKMAMGEGHEEIGYSANQLKELNKKFVYSVEQPSESEFDSILQVNENRIIPYITKAIQELYKDIQEIKDFMKGEQQ